MQPGWNDKRAKFRSVVLAGRARMVPAVVAGALLAGVASAQSTPVSSAPTSYDVSTVKPAAPGQNGMMLNNSHGELRAENVTLVWLLTSAFHAREDQIAGEPDWAKQTHFDITAKLTDVDAHTANAMSDGQSRALLLSLLAERFGLKYHEETRDAPIETLLPAKTGLKLTPAAYPDDKTRQVNGICNGCISWGNHTVKGHAIDVAEFADLLAMQLRRDVRNETGYSGKIDIDLAWAPDVGDKPLSDEQAALPPLPQALEKGLGLRLVSGRGPVKRYVIDHIEAPSGN